MMRALGVVERVEVELARGEVMMVGPFALFRRRATLAQYGPAFQAVLAELIHVVHVYQKQGIDIRTVEPADTPRMVCLFLAGRLARLWHSCGPSTKCWRNHDGNEETRSRAACLRWHSRDNRRLKSVERSTAAPNGS